jgi:glucosamine 6-phosphate synthetase-like amidotransferase/phosphosugar isomerase protein
MAHDARFLIGHCRFATQGSPDNNLNNHPHPADGGWIVHNGVIGEYRDLVRRHELSPVTGCDSELLGLLIEQRSGTLRARCAESARLVGAGPLVLLGLWSRPGRLVAVRSGNPLHLGEVGDGAGASFYLGSLPDGLPGKVAAVEDRSVLEFTTRELLQDRLPARRAEEPAKKNSWWFG